MLDPKLFRNDPEKIAEQLKRHGYDLDIPAYQALESERRTLQDKTQELQTRRNKVSKEIGFAKSKGDSVDAIMEQVSDLGDNLKQNEFSLSECQQALLDFQLMIPNVLHESVPEGNSEDDNVEVRKWGDVPKYDFEPKDHIALGESMKLLDFEAAAKLSGSRFVVIHGNLARLQRALAQFMLDLHTQEHGYQEVYVPYLVHSDVLYGSGQLPKFKEDLFTVEGEWDLTLIPTAEVPVVNLARDSIINESDLPKKYVAQTPCFRSEAGSYGKDVRGLIRQHQFQKVEMIQLVKPENSYEALEEIVGHAEKVLQLLEIPYRTMLLCSGDTGFASAKTYDLESWMPGQNKYREISSCSNCESFQARRMKARYRPKSGKPKLLHTLNGSGLAVGRTLIAVMENYQDKDGNIRVPKVLQSYMGGVTVVSAL